MFPSQNVADYLPLLDSLEIKNVVAQKLDLESPGGIVITYEFNKDNNYVSIATQESTPEKAKELNDVFVQTYINRINAQFELIAIYLSIYLSIYLFIIIK